MCLAIGPAYQPQRSRLGRLWWRIASAPFRLFCVGTALHAAALGVLLLTRVPVHDAPPLLAALIAAGTVGLLLFGYVFTAIPTWADRCPVHYMRYSSTWLALNGGLIAMELEAGWQAGSTVAGALALLAGLALALQGIREYQPWIRPRYRARAALAVTTACLTGGGAALTLLGM